MEINYNLTEEDFINFNLYHIKNSKTAIRSLQLQRMIGPLIFLISSYVFSKIGDVPFIGLFITFSIISILWFIFYPKYFYNHIIRHVKKMIKEGKNDGLLGEHRMMISEEGIVDSTTNGETKVNWSGIKELKEDGNYLYLYNSSVSAYILPKRELRNVDDMRSLFKSKIKS